MDKSDSELLADWDVVSFVYDTEQRSGVTENIINSPIGSSTHSNIDVSAKDDTENVTDASAKNLDNDREITDVCSETPISFDTKQTVENIVSPEEINDADPIIKQAVEIGSEQNIRIDNSKENTEVSVLENFSVAGDAQHQISATSAVSSEISPAEEKTNSNDEEKEKSIITEVQEKPIEKVCTLENENIYTREEKNKENIIYDQEPGMSVECNDHVVNSSLDSSIEHIQVEHCGRSFVQDVPELISDFIEQENAAIESSSSDIDIIDENVEENITSSFVHPISLSISSSVDTSSLLTTPSEGDREVKTELKTEDMADSFSKTPIFHKSEHFERSTYEEKTVEPEPQAPHSQNSTCGIVAGILEFIRNMTRLEWSILGGVMLCLYVTIVFNQTNIFAVVEKEDVVSQMKKMIEELKYDNKMLKDQMLSEMKNEKIFSTFEHQIKELKKENSKLNHMLYDVAKVLEEQKHTHKRFEKREADYAAPFKKEINQLKEHINMLKFDNEELQKQLVRMRYASYSQGGKDISDEKTEKQKEEKSEETANTEEIALDLNSLKKWNELITLLSKELGLSEDEQPFAGEKPEIKNIKWYWKVFLKEFKGTFKDFKANVSSVISDYKKANHKAVSEIYKYVKDFFTVQENDQKYIPPDEKTSQWKNIGDFVKDLGEKWTKIKDRIYTSDIRNFVNGFKKSGDADNSHAYNPGKERSPVYEYNEQMPTNDNSESDEKYDKATELHKPEDSKWMFKRAELRAKLRDSEKREDDSVNWYLKRKERTSQKEEIKF